MVQAIDQRAIDGAMDDESDGSGSNGRSNGWCKRSSSDRPESNMRSDGLCKRLFRDLKKEC